MYPLYMGESLLHHGFSLLPVRGAQDSSAPKAAALDWKVFQHRRATVGDVATWTQLKDWQIAIATGRISGVVVIDFDDMDLWIRFSSANPHLIRGKLIVRTRRGIHLYIPVATTGSPIQSTHKELWGLQADGRYVIAPRSVIDGHTYTIIAGSLETMPAPTPGQLKEILAWLQPDGASAPVGAAVQPVLPGIGRDRLELIQAMRAYFADLVSVGRNNAAFKTLTWARDRGLSHSECLALLADFIAAPGDAIESERSRTREFMATLRSAFSRPAREARAAPVRLPDSVRQALSRLKLTHIWRILDLLFGAGIRPGQTVTRKEALAACGDHLGERNVWRALSNNLYFQLIKGKGSLALSPNTYGVEPERQCESSEIRGEKCKYSRGTKLQLNAHSNKGRPPHLYLIPTIETIARLVGIQKPRWSSPIKHSSTKEARIRTYEAKIKHKPGIYANATRAGWLGVSPKTIKRYDRELKIVARPQYEEVPLASWNVESLPDAAMGHWLQSDGKRYPTVPALAHKLVKQGRVSLVKQLPNYICTAEHLQQQKQTVIARTQAADVPMVQPVAMPQIAAKTPQKAIHKPVMERKPLQPTEPLFKASKVAVEHRPADLVQPVDNGYPDDALRNLKRQWAMLAGVGISSTTTKSDRLELVHRVMPGAGEQMSDRDYGYLLDAHPRRMLMWLRKRIGDPAYTHDDVARLYKLMGGEMTRKKAVALFSQFGRNKTLRCAEFVSGKPDIQSKPAYLITCLRADQRMAALLGGH